MKFIARLFSGYHDFVHKHTPAPLKHLRFLAILLAILAVPVTLLLIQTSQDTRQRASGLNLTPQPVIDPYTREFFDLEIKSIPTGMFIPAEGGQHGISVTFEAGGNKIANTSNLTGFLQQEDGRPEQKINFTKTGAKFTSANVVAYANGCMHLYSSTNKDESQYLATTCFGRGTQLDAGQNQRGIAYGYFSQHQPIIEFEYSSGKEAIVFISTSAFDKNNPNFTPGRPSTRIFHVNTTGNQAEFKNVRYKTSFPYPSMTNTNYLEYQKICEGGPKAYQRIFRRASTIAQFISNDNTVNSAAQIIGSCQFEYVSPNALEVGYMGIAIPEAYQSLYFSTEQIPPPSIHPSSYPTTPTPAPTCTPAENFGCKTDQNGMTVCYDPPPGVVLCPPKPTTPTPSPMALYKPPCMSYGDANLDRYVSGADADLISRFIAGLSQPNPTQFINSDVDKDGKLTISDALAVRSYSQGLAKTFTACSISPTPTAPPQLPDLTLDMKAGGVSTSWNAGSLKNPVNVKYKIINLGNGPTVINYTSTSSPETPSSTAIDNTCVNKSTILNPGQTCLVSTNYTFSSYGMKYFKITLDPFSDIKEINENNNVFSTQINLVQVSPSPTPAIPTNYPTPFPSYPLTPIPTFQATPTSPTTAYKCDFNQDKILNVLDYNIWLMQFTAGGKPQSPSADCNKNGTVDLYDYNLWLSELRGI